MNWIQKLERKFGRYAIHNLMYYIIIWCRICSLACETGILLSVLGNGCQCDFAWTDLESSYLFNAAAFIKSYFYGVCIIFVLYDRTAFGSDMGCISI